MTEHTPTPWKVYDKHGTVAVMATKTPAPKNEIVHWTGFDASHFPEQVSANAAFIVKAVNNHDALVRALEYALGELCYIATKHGYVSTESAVVRVRAALDPVGGGQGR